MVLDSVWSFDILYLVVGIERLLTVDGFRFSFSLQPEDELLLYVFLFGDRKSSQLNITAASAFLTTSRPSFYLTVNLTLRVFFYLGWA